MDLGFPGVVSVGGAWERFRIATDPSQTLVVEQSRRSAALGFGGWVTAGLRPSTEIRLDRWSAEQRYLVPALGVELRTLSDRLKLAAATDYAIALSTQDSYLSGGAGAMWVSSLGLGRAAWSARVGFDWAGRHAPLGTWPVAGGDLSWALPLRAHAPTRQGFLSGSSAGRTGATAGLAGDKPIYRVGPLVVAAGVFLDAARIVTTADGSPDRFYLDGGGGLRIGVDDGGLGVLRVDLARSLVADRRSALTVGVHQSWPLFPRKYP
jgi:hypothetical protein